MAKKKTEGQPPPPVVRVAPLGELKAYTVSEHELERLARGSVGSDLLTIAYVLLSAAITLLVTILSAPLPQLHFILFFCSFLITTIAGIVCLIVGWRTRESARVLINEIKNRMPPPLAIQELSMQQGLLVSQTVAVVKVEGAEAEDPAAQQPPPET
jgi:hypothetical protein